MLTFLIVFIAIFTQTVTGFGLALVSMPLLVGLLGIQTAAPLVAIVAGVAELLLLVRYRADLNLRAVSRLTAASLLGVPLGIVALRQADGDLITRLLGVLVLGYAAYALFGPTLPALNRPAWAYGFGFVSGILSGAYNTGGPPVIIYGNCRRWPPAEFKSNLQGFFLVNSSLVLIGHALSGNFTAVVGQQALIALPAILLAVLLGTRLDHYLDAERFRRIVLLVLLGLGASLLLR